MILRRCCVSRRPCPWHESWTNKHASSVPGRRVTTDVCRYYTASDGSRPTTIPSLCRARRVRIVIFENAAPLLLLPFIIGSFRGNKQTKSQSILQNDLCRGVALRRPRRLHTVVVTRSNSVNITMPTTCKIAVRTHALTDCIGPRDVVRRTKQNNATINVYRRRANSANPPANDDDDKVRVRYCEMRIITCSKRTPRDICYCFVQTYTTRYVETDAFRR